MNEKNISTFSVPLGEPKKEDTVPMGKMIIVRSPEICLTCGGTKRLKWTEKVDGRKVEKQVCLFCVTKIHTAANRRDH
jgi:hypothetical protein